MSTRSDLSSVRRAGGYAVAAGTLFAAVGAAAWATVTSQLRAEKITVPANAPALAGAPVQGPVSAYIEAQVIKGNAERGAGGRTYADVSAALQKVEKGSQEEADLRKQSAALSTASALRTSLFTSVLAYGVSAFAAGMGALLVVVGGALRRAGR